MITVVHLDSLGGVNYHRIMAPLMRMKQTHGVNLHFIQSLSELKDMNLDKVDNLLVSRKLSVTNHKEFKKMLVNNGIRLILDNDDFWNLNEENPAYGLYKTYYGPDIKKTIQIADVIWTPNKYLARQMSHLNHKADIKFINNALNLDEKQWYNQRKTTKDNLWFGYLGAAAHIRDIKLMGQVFDEKNILCVKNLGYDEVLNATKTVKPLGVFEYGKYYKRIDVSLAPLAKNKFNRCKSDLKVTEAAMTKTAIIASDVENYNWSIVDGETGILCSTPEQWKEAVASMTKEKAKKLGSNLYESLKDDPYHNIDLVNEVRAKYMF